MSIRPRLSSKVVTWLSTVGELRAIEVEKAEQRYGNPSREG
jgi:hypothetical protein